MSRRTVASPIGPLVVTATALGVSGVGWMDRAQTDDLDESPAAAAMLDRTVQELTEYFAGERTVFEVPIDRRTRRGFRGEVLDALERVCFGETVTYGELAERAGRPRAARAVGSAMATNPIAVVVPCHRVVPATGGIGHFGGGVEAKRTLLRLEGVSFVEG